MSRLFRIVVAALGLWLSVVAGPALAQEISGEIRAAAAARASEFDAMVMSGRMGDGVDFLPPGVVEAIAAQYGVSVDQAREATRAAVGATLRDVVIVSAAHDFAAAQVRVTPIGGRTYLAVPMNMTLQAGEISARATSTTFMLQEQGQWWLITLQEGPMMDVFLSVYPEFRGMDLPADTFEIVE